ncbi:MAG TPA: hypothetical protein VHG27_07190 [Xanthobacteraceae bacterium]|nr:hypothetical protein [Xanthobacteraceae bacterium]
MRQTVHALPSLMIPCPQCLVRMSFRSIRPGQETGLRDETYACDGCGAELVRTTYSAAR